MLIEKEGSAVIKSKNFKKRLLSSVALILIFCCILSNNLFLYISTIQIILFLTIWEFLRLFRLKESNHNLIKNNNDNFLLTRQKIKISDYFVIFLINVFNLYLYFDYSPFLFSIFFILLTFLFLLFKYRLKVVLGIFYFSIPFFILNYYKNNFDFTLFLAVIVLITISTDVGGYIFGNLIGGRKLMKKISPNKTISGAFGGLIFSIIFLSSFFLKQTSYLGLFFYSIFFSIIVQIGDLFESYIKRKCYVKDSSNIIPGHGGLLDRFDGMFLLINVISILNILGFNFFFIR